MIIEYNKITAEDNMILTNGKLYTKRLYLSVNDSPENWKEITAEEYESIIKEQKEREDNNG